MTCEGNPPPIFGQIKEWIKTHPKPTYYIRDINLALGLRGLANERYLRANQAAAKMHGIEVRPGMLQTSIEPEAFERVCQSAAIIRGIKAIGTKSFEQFVKEVEDFIRTKEEFSIHDVVRISGRKGLNTPQREHVRELIATHPEAMIHPPYFSRTLFRTICLDIGPARGTLSPEERAKINIETKKALFKTARSAKVKQPKPVPEPMAIGVVVESLSLELQYSPIREALLLEGQSPIYFQANSKQLELMLTLAETAVDSSQLPLTQQEEQLLIDPVIAEREYFVLGLGLRALNNRGQLNKLGINRLDKPEIDVMNEAANGIRRLMEQPDFDLDSVIQHELESVEAKLAYLFEKSEEALTKNGAEKVPLLKILLKAKSQGKSIQEVYEALKKALAV